MRTALTVLIAVGVLVFLPAINDAFGSLTTLVGTHAWWMNDAMVNVVPVLGVVTAVRSR